MALSNFFHIISAHSLFVLSLQGQQTTSNRSLTVLREEMEVGFLISALYSRAGDLCLLELGKAAQKQIEPYFASYDLQYYHLPVHGFTLIVL